MRNLKEYLITEHFVNCKNESEMKQYGDIDAAFKMKTTGDTVKFGNIKARSFQMSSPKIKTIEFGNDCDILEPNFEQCESLENIKGNLGMPTEFDVSK